MVVMIEIVIALLMIVNGEIKEHRIQTAMSDCLKGKRIAEITTALAQEEAGGQKEDPLIALKQRELDLRAMDMQRKAQENMEAEERKAGEFEERIDLDKMKLESAEDQAGERIRIAEEKIDLNREKQNESKQQKS